VTNLSPARRFVVTLVARESDVPADIRLRAALKVLSRRFRFRCSRVQEFNEKVR